MFLGDNLYIQILWLVYLELLSRNRLFKALRFSFILFLELRKLGLQSSCFSVVVVEASLQFLFQTLPGFDLLLAFADPLGLVEILLIRIVFRPLFGPFCNLAYFIINIDFFPRLSLWFFRCSSFAHFRMWHRFRGGLTFLCTFGFS